MATLQTALQKRVGEFSEPEKKMWNLLKELEGRDGDITQESLANQGNVGLTLAFGWIERLKKQGLLVEPDSILDVKAKKFTRYRTVDPNTGKYPWPTVASFNKRELLDYTMKYIEIETSQTIKNILFTVARQEVKNGFATLDAFNPMFNVSKDYLAAKCVLRYLSKLTNAPYYILDCGWEPELPILDRGWNPKLQGNRYTFKSKLAAQAIIKKYNL